MKNKDLLDGEVGMMYKTTYALIDRGDGVRCGWCGKKNPTEKHLKQHE